MPGTYAADDYDLAGFIVGVVEKSRARRVREGDVLLGLPSAGLHTNGYTLARKVLLEMEGHWHRSISPSSGPRSNTGRCPSATTRRLACCPTTPDVGIPMPSSVVGSAEGRAFVPVQRFWSARRDISFEEIRAAMGGESNTFSRVLVAVKDRRTVGDAGRGAGRLDHHGDPRGDRRGRRPISTRARLVPLDKVRPDLQALSVDGRSLFGGTRNDDLSDWPLIAQPAPSDLAVDERSGATAEASAYAPGHEAPTWTLAAAGDVMLDREVYRQAILLDRGPDHPWDGGFARIDPRTCCTVDGGNAIETKRVGPRGAVRDLLSSADVAVVNHEGPAPDDSSYHPSGLVFTFDPALLEGVAASGIDIVSLANNHIRNAGSSGVLQTMRNLRTADLRSVGAGADADSARKARCLDRAGVRLCFLAYDAINTVVHAATLDRPGAAELQLPHTSGETSAVRAGTGPTSSLSCRTGARSTRPA